MLVGQKDVLYFIRISIYTVNNKAKNIHYRDSTVVLHIDHHDHMP